MQKYAESIASPAPWLGLLPSHWECKKIGSLFSERKTKVSDKDYPPLSVAKIGIVPQLATAVKTDAGDNRKLVCAGDFVINSRSDRKGSCGVSEIDGSVSLINIVLTPRSQWNGRYVHYLMRSQPFSEEYYRNGRGIVSDLWTTRFSEMKSILLPIPPRAEQDQIVCFLDWKVSGINKLISSKRKQIKVLEEQEKRIISDAVLRGLHGLPLRDSGNRWIGEIPAGWDVIKLGKFCSFQNGISESGDFFTSGTPFVGYGDVYRHLELPKTVSGVAQANEQQQEVFSVRKGDIFFTRTSENIDEIGMAAVCKHTIEKAVFSGFVIRCRPRTVLIDIDYMKYYLQIPAIRNHFSSMMNIVIRASLGQNLLKQMPVVIPPMDEQKEIAAYLDIKHSKYVDLIETIQKEIEVLDELKTRLISDVVTGKIDVRDVKISDYEYVEEDADTNAVEDSDRETEEQEEV